MMLNATVIVKSTVISTQLSAECIIGATGSLSKQSENPCIRYTSSECTPTHLRKLADFVSRT